jgi:hypothetical protein
MGTGQLTTTAGHGQDGQREALQTITGDPAVHEAHWRYAILAYYSYDK